MYQTFAKHRGNALLRFLQQEYSRPLRLPMPANTSDDGAGTAFSVGTKGVVTAALMDSVEDVAEARPSFSLPSLVCCLRPLSFSVLDTLRRRGSGKGEPGLRHRMVRVYPPNSTPRSRAAAAIYNRPPSPTTPTKSAITSAWTARGPQTLAAQTGRLTDRCRHTH